MRELLPVIGSSVFFDLLKSILLLLILLIARTVLVRWIKGNQTLTIDAKRRWIVTARNSMVLGLFVGLVVIWAHELEAFAVSLVALAATVVLATKELILCWSGAALRVGGGVYGVGDRIQLGTYRGVVLEYDVFATKLLEIGPGSDVAPLYRSNRGLPQQSSVWKSLDQREPVAGIRPLCFVGSASEHGRLASR